MSRALLGVAVALALLAAGCGDDDGEPSAATVARPPGTSVYDLAQGDCVNGLGEGQDLRVRVVPCRRRHEAEVYGTVELGPANEFPGVDVLRRQAQSACAPLYGVYTGEPPGIPGAGIALTEIVPTSASWAAGDRSAVCVALGAGGRALRGSIHP